MPISRKWIKRLQGGYWHCTCDDAVQQRQCDKYSAGDEEYCRWCYDEDGRVVDWCLWASWKDGKERGISLGAGIAAQDETQG